MNTTAASPPPFPPHPATPPPGQGASPDPRHGAPPPHAHGTPPPQPHPGWGPAWNQPPLRQPRTSRLPSGAEALGWGGGFTTLIGVLAVTWDFWSRISDGALVALLVTASTVLGVAAAVVGDVDRRERDTFAAQLSVALWWMTGIATCITTYVAADVVSGGAAFLGLLAASAAGTAMCGAVAHRTDRDSARAGTVVGAAVSAFSLASLASMTGSSRALAVWIVALLALGVLTMLLSHLETRMSYATALVLLLGAAQGVLGLRPTTAEVWVLLVGMTAAAILALMRRTTSEGITTAVLAGLVGCQVLYELAPDVFSLSTTVLVAGIGMTATCIWLVRRASGSDPSGSGR